MRFEIALCIYLMLKGNITKIREQDLNLHCIIIKCTDWVISYNILIIYINVCALKKIKINTFDWTKFVSLPEEKCKFLGTIENMFVFYIREMFSNIITSPVIGQIN
jgi:hypothetical protein